ncbi:hypothetical protein CR513_43637, partial [Mucuna pruriens]
MIARVLIDNGSSLNVLPKATLDMLCSINPQLKTSSMVVRAFDVSKREVMGQVTRPICIGPTVFDVTFQVMDIYLAYSSLLGRPWIHVAGAVPSSIHQRVKFIMEHQLISVMEEKRTSATSSGLENPTPTAAKDMAFRIMIKEGYQPGKGLGPHLKGIPAPITIQENVGKAGLGYQRGNKIRNLSPS